MTKLSPWFAYVRPGPVAAKLRLLCFPYAAGSASVFREWQALVPPGVEVWPVQYPGRETRWGEPRVEKMEGMVRPLVDSLRPFLGTPFAFFGHSLGALVAFELAHALAAEHAALPVHLVLSACSPPHDTHGIGDVAGLPDDVLLERLGKLEGIPQAALESPALLEVMLPVIRADLTLAGGYRFADRPPLSCPMTVLGGLGDEAVPPSSLEGWARYSSQSLGVRLFRGNHFFLRGQEHQLLASILGPVGHLLR